MKNLITKLLVVAMFFTILPANLVMAEDNQEKQKQQVSSKGEEKVKKKEAIDKRTEKSKTFYNNNGTATTEIHQSPIHYQDPTSKKWKEIDNTLVKKSTSDTYTNGGNVFQVAFTDTLTKEKPVMEMTEKDYSVSLNPLSSNGKEPRTTEAKVKENKVTYVEAYENTDLVYSVGNEKVKEDIILKEKPVTHDSISYTFAMDLKGLTHEVQEDGRILLKDKKSGDTIYYLEKPYMFDSLQPEGFTGFSESAVPEEALSYEVEMKTETKGNQLLVSIIPSKDWLLDHSRTYPVTIDPTIVKYQPVTELMDTNIRSALPTQTGGSDLELGAGLYKNSTTNNVIRSLLNFDVSDIPAGVRVIDAQLNLWASSVWNDTSVRLDLHPATSAWEENAATWNKRTASASWTTGGGDYGSPHYSSQTVGALGSTLDSNHYKWSIAPSNLEKTINSGSSNLGFLLKSASETTAAYKKFYSGDNLDYAGYSPLLAITYVTNSRLGIEDYWTYDEQELTDGRAFVNLGTGNGVLQFSDFEISSRGHSGISFERTYNTKASETNSFGPGWSFTGSESITEQTADKNIIYTDRDGTAHVFLYKALNDSYQTPAGIYLTLAKDGSDYYILTDKFGTISRYKKIAQDTNTSNFSIAKLEYKKDRNGNTTFYTYNTKGNITGITDASGRKMTINHGSSGISSINFEGKKFSYHYTYEGLLKEVRKYKDATNYTSTSFVYDINGKLEKVIDANNKITQINYKNGFVHSIIEPSTSESSLQPVVTYSYDIVNYTSEVIDPEGGITKYNLNNNYVISSLSNPVGDTYSNDKVDENYNPTHVTDGEMNISQYEYDAKGNLTKEIDSKGNVTSYSYDLYSNIETVTNVKGTIYYSYDAKGNLINILDAEGNTQEFTYDVYGNMTSTTFPDGSQERYTYDTNNNYKNSITDLLGRTTTTVTDAFGNISSIVDAKGNQTTYSYDDRQLLKQIQDAYQKTTSYEYDANQNLVSVKSASDKTTAFTYNDQNQLTSKKQPMGNITTMTYDNNGNVASVIKPSSDVISTDYNDANQLVSLYGNDVQKWIFTYNGNGDLRSSENILTGQVKIYNYDVNGNLSTEEEAGSSKVYEYNEMNQLVSLTGKSMNSTFIQSFQLDANGGLKEISRNGEKLVSFNYTGSGLPLTIDSSNGVNSSYYYDSAQQLETVDVKINESTYLSESFGYDANGNVLTLTSNLGNREYTYDSLNQLLSQSLADGSSETYEYDNVGNRKKKEVKKDGTVEVTQYTHNDNNQLTAVNGKIYQYDQNGNRIQDAQFIYEYDEFDKLKTIRNLSNQIVASYTYDEEGRRVNKTINNEKTIYHYSVCQFKLDRSTPFR